jgi:hypothetical protein
VVAPMSLRERYRPIALASNMLVIGSFAVLIVLLGLDNALTVVNIAIGCAIILIANLLFVFSGMLTPALVAPGKIAFPLNFTLPLVYSAWCAVVAYLSWRIGNPLEPTLDAFQRFANHFKPIDFLWFPVVQCAVMTVSAVLNTRNPATESVDSA